MNRPAPTIRPVPGGRTHRDRGPRRAGHAARTPRGPGSRALARGFPTGALVSALCVVALAGPATPPGAQEARAPLTWENLEERLEREAARGLAGSVLVVRDGRVVLDRGYGFADPDKKIPNRPDTIYAIGSTPIDFTRAGILLLAQRGKLHLDDPITKFFDKVPPDKRAITLEHLMSGRSGLRDFLGRPSDPNPDHYYITRDEALRRIFEDELLFEPGTGRRHSHAAWGVLAAVIEVAGGASYPEFTRKHLFAPAGMRDTGFFGEPCPAERMAIGQSPTTSGKINAPPYWGPTSWLVMGSGGQVSTTWDLYRWHRALAEGKILDEEHLARYWSPRGSLLTGGDMFGFEIVYTQGPDDMFILASNAGGPAGVERIQSLGRELASLVLAGQGTSPSGEAPAYSLGVQLGIDATDAGLVVLVDAVVPGSAAERDGLRPGDRLLSADGTPFGDDPLAVLDPLLRTGQTIRFEIERDGTRKTVEVTPRPRSSS